jgi:hypothetical protein
MVQPLQTTPENSNNIPNIILKKTFLVNNVKQYDKTRESIRLEFRCYDIEIKKLYLNVNYANDKTAGPVSPYKIISDVMNKVRLFI